MKTSYFTAIAALALFPLLCAAAGSAALSFELTPSTASTTPDRIAVTLRSGVALNAVEGTLTLPKGVAFAGIQETSSVVSYWITEPKYNTNTRQITFAGLLLGGRSGTTKLFEFLVSPPAQKTVISFDSGRAFTDSPNGIETPLVRSSLTLYPVQGPMDIPRSYILIGVIVILLLVVCLWRMRIRWI